MSQVRKVREKSEKKIDQENQEKRLQSQQNFLF